MFRSEHQLRLLGELFLRGAPRSIVELASATAIPQATVSREVARLEAAGILSSARRGRLRLVEPDNRLPWSGELRSLLMKTIGPRIVLAEELADVAGIDEAYVFGSWAARHQGIDGPAPNDIDVLVIGEPDLDELYAALRRAERRLHIDVNPVTRSAREWAQPDDPFLQQVRQGALVPIGAAP